jgi:hypothetical protein
MKDESRKIQSDEFRPVIFVSRRYFIFPTLTGSLNWYNSYVSSLVWLQSRSGGIHRGGFL